MPALPLLLDPLPGPKLALAFTVVTEADELDLELHLRVRRDDLRRYKHTNLT